MSACSERCFKQQAEMQRTLDYRESVNDKLQKKVEELEKARDYHIASVGKVVKESRAEIEALEAKADRYHSALAVIYANPHEPQAAQIAENALYDVEDTDAGNNR